MSKQVVQFIYLPNEKRSWSETLDEWETRIANFSSSQMVEKQTETLEKIKKLALRRTKWSHVRIVCLTASTSTLLESLILFLTVGWGLFFPVITYQALQFLPMTTFVLFGINQILYRTIAQDHSHPKYEHAGRKLCRWQLILRILLLVAAFLLISYCDLPQALWITIACIGFINFFLSWIFALYVLCMVK